MAEKGHRLCPTTWVTCWNRRQVPLIALPPVQAPHVAWRGRLLDAPAPCSCEKENVVSRSVFNFLFTSRLCDWLTCGRGRLGVYCHGDCVHLLPPIQHTRRHSCAIGHSLLASKVQVAACRIFGACSHLLQFSASGHNNTMLLHTWPLFGGSCGTLKSCATQGGQRRSLGDTPSMGQADPGDEHFAISIF
jgi:hypothetical protein